MMQLEFRNGVFALIKYWNYFTLIACYFFPVWPVINTYNFKDTTLK